MVGHVPKSLSVLVLVAVLCTSVSAPAIAASPEVAPTTDKSAQNTASPLQVAANNSTENSTDHHVNPDNATSDGDLLKVRGWLTGQLGDQLSQSAITISQGQYEQGRSLLGDQYDSRLGQLVDVAGETASDEDDDLGDSFADIQRTQRNFSEAAQEYEETYEAYQEAVESGNETAARRHARELQEIENRLQHLNQSLVEDYETLGNRTGTNFTQAIGSISNLSENVSSQQTSVEETIFTETALQVTSDSETISYDDPLIANGQLVGEDNSPLSNREITLRVGRQTKQVQTDDEGRFSFRYRPRLIPANTSQLSIRYLPQNDSQYLDSSATLPVTVEQVEANLTITSIPSSTSFGDQLEIQTSVTHSGEPVSGIPVEGSLGSYQLTERRTDISGSGVLQGIVPASVPTGQQQVTVSMAAEQRAVTVTPVSASVAVRSTNTTLSIHGERVEGNQVRIFGELITSEGVAVPDRAVQVSISDSVKQSVDTDQNGTYTLLVNQSALPEGTNTSVFVTAAFNGQGINLDSTSTTQELTFDPLIPGESQSGESGSASDDGPFNLGILVIVMLAGGALLALSWRYYRSSSSEGGDMNRAVTEAVAKEGEQLVALDLSHGQSLADERPEAAVLWAYQNVREYLSELTGANDSDTHWEFYTKCQQNLGEDQVSELRDLIEAYEVVRFNRSNAEIDVNSIIDALETEPWTESTTGSNAD